MATKGRKKTKFTETDLNKMRREIRNFNARRAYQIKKHPETAELQPGKMTMKKALARVESKRDLTGFIKSMQGYTSETAQTVSNKYGVKATKYAVKESRKQVERENRKRARELKSGRDVYVNGKKIETAEKTASTYEKKPIQQDFYKIETAEAWKRFQREFKFMGSDAQKKLEKKIYMDKLKAGFDKKISDDYLWYFYEALGQAKIWQLYEEGFDSVDLDYIYDIAIEEDEKHRKILEELGAQVIQHGKAQTIINKMGKYWKIDKDLKKLWKKFTPEKLIQLWIDGTQINDYNDLLREVGFEEDEDEDENGDY